MAQSQTHAASTGRPMEDTMNYRKIASELRKRNISVKHDTPTFERLWKMIEDMKNDVLREWARARTGVSGDRQSFREAVFSCYWNEIME